MGTVVLELDYVEFTCPVGYIFEGSFNFTHYAICYNWGYDHAYDPAARCVPINCPCPRWFPNDTWTGTHSWTNGLPAADVDNRKPPVCDPDDHVIPMGTKVSYTCPEGFVFETPELIHNQQEQGRNSTHLAVKNSDKNIFQE